jgi:hypothetical protein
MRRNTDLAVIAAVTVAAALVTGLTGGGGPAIAWLRVLAGVPLVLVLPGYALTAFTLPARSPRGFSLVLWRGLWSTGLSLAVAVLGGLLLNVFPVGLTRVSWTILLAAVTLLALAATVPLRLSSQRLSSQRLSSQRLSSRPLSSWRPTRARAWRPTWAVVGYPLAALAFAGTATGLAVVSGGRPHSPPFAELWLVPGTGKTILGVRSAYPARQAFHLVLKDGVGQADSWDFTLAPGQSWRRAVSASAGQQLTAQLSATGHAQTENVAITSGGTA